MKGESTSRQVLISTDGHAGADLLGYKPYLERRWHDEFDAWAASFHDAWVEENDQDRPENQRLGVASAGAPLNWDGPLRLEHLDDQGIAAEVLFPNTSAPFYPSGALTSPGPRTTDEFERRFDYLYTASVERWIFQLAPSPAP